MAKEEDEMKRLNRMINMRKEITCQESVDDSSYDLDMNQVLSIAKSKSSVKSIIDKSKSEPTFLKKSDSFKDFKPINDEDDDYSNVSILLNKAKQNEKAKVIEEKSMAKMVNKLAEKQKSFISKATSLDSEDNNDFYKPFKNNTQLSTNSLINTSSNIPDSSVDVSLNDLIKKNQTEAQILLSQLKNKKKSFLESILDN